MFNRPPTHEIPDSPPQIRADADSGGGKADFAERARIKRITIEHLRLQHRKLAI
jgi:hypothetical protein